MNIYTRNHSDGSLIQHDYILDIQRTWCMTTPTSEDWVETWFYEPDGTAITCKECYNL